MRTLHSGWVCWLVLGVSTAGASSFLEKQEWYRRINHDGMDEAWHIHELDSGQGFVLTGKTTPDGPGELPHAFMLRVDANAGPDDTTWDYYTPTSGGQSIGYEIHPVTHDPNTDFIFAGRTTEAGYDQMLIRLVDHQFQEVWSDPVRIGTAQEQMGAFAVQPIAVGSQTGFIVAGFSRDYEGDPPVTDNDKTNAILIRLRTDGTEEWRLEIDEYGDYDVFKSVKVGPDGFYAIGFTRKPSGQSAGQFDVLFVRVNWDGTRVSNWPQGSIGTTVEGEFAQNLKATDGTAWVFTGGNYTDSVPNGYVVRTKTDGTGAVQWEREVGLSAYDYLQSITNLNPGSGDVPDDFVALGITFNQGHTDNLIAKLDWNGNVIYKRRVGGPYFEYGYWVQSLASGGFVICGATTSGTEPAGDADIFISKFSPVYCGDVNGSGTITTGDVIYLQNYIFKGGPPPAGGIIQGDVNGTGCASAPTSADVIRLVNIALGTALPDCPWCGGP